MFAGAIGGVGLTFYLMFQSGAWSRFVLNTDLRRDESSEARESEHRSRYLGKVGTAVSPLRPTGIVEIDNERIGNVGFSFPTGPAITSAVWTLAITMLLLVALLSSLGKYLPRSQRFGQLILAPELSSSQGYTAAETRDDLLGVTGEALTALRPSGMAKLNDERVDVVTSGEYIPKGETVLVMSVNDGRVQVRMADRTA